MKVCKECKTKKPLSEFYKHPETSDGYLNKCKECKRTYALKYREENLEEVREKDRKKGRTDKHRARVKIYHATDRGKQKASEAKARWRKKNPLKRKAHDAVARALRAGVIKKKPCRICKSKNVEAHHEDYSKPLKVIWFCNKHHAEHHLKEN